MQVNFIELFNLKSDFTKDELKNALLSKINMIETLKVSPIDKKFLLEQYFEQYNLAKEYLVYMDNPSSSPIQLLTIPEEHFSNINNSYNQMIKQFQKIKTQFSNSNFDYKSDPNSKVKSNVFSQSYSYQSVLNPDGTRTVLESKNKMDNGKSNDKTESYIIDSKGNKKPIELAQAKKYLQYKN
jgi:hypothetical protein